MQSPWRCVTPRTATHSPVSYPPAKCQPCRNGLWTPRRGLECRPGRLTLAAISPAAPVPASLCSPSLPFQPPPDRPRLWCKVTSLPAAGAKLSKHSQAQGGLEERHGQHSDPPLPGSPCQPPPAAFTPSSALPLSCIHLLSSSLSQLHTHLLSLAWISQLQPAAAQPSTPRAQRHKGIYPPTPPPPPPPPDRPVTQTEGLTHKAHRNRPTDTHAEIH